MVMCTKYKTHCTYINVKKSYRNYNISVLKNFNFYEYNINIFNIALLRIEEFLT